LEQLDKKSYSLHSHALLPRRLVSYTASKPHAPSDTGTGARWAASGVFHPDAAQRAPVPVSLGGKESVKKAGKESVKR